MATIRKNRSKWQVLIRKHNLKPIYKTFILKEDAVRWARETEVKIEQELYEDLALSKITKLKDVLAQYRDRVSVNKKGYDQERYKINKIIGNYKNGVAIGKVTAEYASKCKFVGEYKDRSIYAQGIYTCPNEYKFEGVWSVDYERGKKGTLTCFIGKKETKNFVPSDSKLDFDGNRWEHSKNKQCI